MFGGARLRCHIAMQPLRYHCLSSSRSRSPRLDDKSATREGLTMPRISAAVAFSLGLASCSEIVTVHDVVGCAGNAQGDAAAPSGAILHPTNSGPSALHGTDSSRWPRL